MKEALDERRFVKDFQKCQAIIVIFFFLSLLFHLLSMFVFGGEKEKQVEPAVIIHESEKIDLNTASVWEIMAIDGIGNVLAERIIEGRPFSEVADLQKVKGIGKENFQKLSPFFKVDLISHE